MKRIIRFGLTLLVSLLLLVSGLILVIVNLDSNSFKPVIQYGVKESTQRSLNIAGDLQIDFYPQIDIRLSNMTLSEFQNDDQFASIEQAQLSLSLWSLLRKQINVDTLKIKGLSARLVRYEDGRTNIEDLLEDDGQPLTFSFDIGRIEIDMGRLALHDEMMQETFILDTLNLTTGRIATGSIEQVNVSSQLFRSGIETVESDSNVQQLVFDAQFEARHISFNDQKIVSGPVAMTIQREEPGNYLNATISIPGIHQSNGNLASTRLHAELLSRQNEHTLQIAIDGLLAARLNDQHWAFTDSNTNVIVSASENKKLISACFSGKLDLDMASEVLQIDIQGDLADTHLDAVVHLQNFSEQNIVFNVQLDQLDLDSFLPLQQFEFQMNTDSEKNELATNIMTIPDFSILNRINLSGAIQIGQLFAGDIQASGIQLSIEPGQHHFDLKQLIH
ncbi:MAG: AsmA family protein [Burkholderiales bacterium]|nr:AsmA family protein [Burkholderiales bacterium]MDR4517503.1 AsmA family protein [Nitrosomonas sp.]